LRFDEVSRWSVLVEVRDTLRAILAPALDLAHLLRRGRALALCLRKQRLDRPMQLVEIRRIFSNL
jgi:hypothetical protein